MATPSQTNPSGTGTPGGGQQHQSNVDRNQIYEWILQLSNPKTRETALLELR